MAGSTPPHTMKSLHRFTYLAVIYGLLLAAARADEKSSPYFQVIGKNNDDSSGEALPLKSSSAKVSIDGTIARVQLTQRYANSGSVPIEAIYVFPASTRAAVHGMTLTRRLHPSRDCLQAAGFDTSEAITVTLGDGSQWARFSATRDGIRRTIHERITSRRDGATWTDVSAWYWAALRHPLNGPWQAETVISSS